MRRIRDTGFGWLVVCVAAAPASAVAAPHSPDPGFGAGGTVVSDIAGRTAAAAGMALDRAGRPVVAATTGPMEVGFLRRGPAGQPDVATTASLGPAGRSQITELAEQANGGHVVGGWVEETTGDRRFALARFTAAGAFDAGFGVRRDPLGDELRALAIAPDEQIVAAGSAGDRIAVARYAADGTADAAFSRVHDFGALSGEEASGVVVEPGGRVLVAGTGVLGAERVFVVAALTGAGTVDGSFGGGGLVTLDIGDGAGAAVRAVARQPDGKLLVAGTTDAGGGGGGLVARFLPDGTPDPGFSSDGIARLGVPGAIVEAVALQPDGKIVVAGVAGGDSLIARFRPGGARDPGFGVDGAAWRPASGPPGPDRLTGVGVAASGAIVGGGLAGDRILLTRLVGGDSSDPALALTAEGLGDLVRFTLSASNLGADPARDVAVAVSPPPGLAASALATAAGPCAAIACALGTVAPGTTVRMTLLARAKAPGALTTSATVSGSTFDADPANNAATATGTATPNRVVRPDRTRPAIKLRLRRKGLKRSRRRVKLTVVASEAVSVRLTARRGKRAFARGRRVTIARKGRKRVALRLTAAGRKSVKRALKRKRRARVRFVVAARASDKAGNKSSQALRATLRR